MLIQENRVRCIPAKQVFIILSLCPLDNYITLTNEQTGYGLGREHLDGSLKKCTLQTIEVKKRTLQTFVV